MVLLPAMAGHANSACLNILSQNRSAENKPKNIFEWKNFSIVIWYESKQNSSSTFFGHSLFVKLTVICFMCYGSFSFFHLSRFCACRLSSIVENNDSLTHFSPFHKRILVFAVTNPYAVILSISGSHLHHVQMAQTMEKSHVYIIFTRLNKWLIKLIYFFSKYRVISFLVIIFSKTFRYMGFDSFKYENNII